MTTDESSPPRHGRWIAPTIAGIAGFAILLVVVAWFARIPLAERAIAELAAAQGIDDIDFQVVEIGLAGARIADLRIGSDRALEIREIEARYTLSGLARGHIDSILAIAPSLKVQIGAGGPSFGSLDALIGPLLKSGPKETRPAAIPALPRLEWRDARIFATTPFGDVTITAGGDLTPAEDGGFDVAADLFLTTEAGPLQGRLEARVEGDGGFAGEFALRDGRLASQGAKGEGIRGTISFAGGAGARPAIAVNIMAATLDLAGARFIAPEVALDVDGDRLRLSIRLEAEGGAAGLELSADADLTTAPMTVQIEGTARGSRESRLWQAWALPPVTDGTADFALTLSGSPAALEGGFTATLAAKSATLDHIAMANPAVTLNGELTLLGGILELRTGQGSVLRAMAVEPAPGITLTGPLDVPVLAGELPLLTLDLRNPTKMPVRYDLRLGSSPFSAKIAGSTGGETLTMDGRTPQLTITGSGDAASGAFESVITARNGTVRLPQLGLRLKGIEARGRHRRPGPASLPLDSFKIGVITFDGTNSPVAPLTLQGNVVRVDGDLAFSGTLADAMNRWTMTIGGDYNPWAESGKARVTVTPLVFKPGALQPMALFPILGTLLADVSGRIAASGEASWSRDGPTLRAVIPIENLSLIIKGISIRGVSGTLVFDSRRGRAPLQLLSIARLELGLPLTDGRVRFRITPNLVFEIEEMTWRLAGGRVFARDLTIDPFAEDRSIVLEAEGIDVAQMLRGVGSDVVSATGRLSGRIPIRIEGGEVAIRGGRLATESPGIIRYDSGLSAEEIRKKRTETALMLQALENFHYEHIVMTIDQEPGGEALIALKIRGKNPDLMSGQPFVFNLNFSGDLVEMVGCFVEGLCSTEQIGQILLQIFE